MYYSTVSLQVSVPFVAKSILHRKIKRSRGFSVSLQVSIAPASNPTPRGLNGHSAVFENCSSEFRPARRAARSALVSIVAEV